MLEASYIGDELTGTGFRLAGIHAHTAPGSAEQLRQLVLDERERRELVMLSAECAPRIHHWLGELLDARPLPPVVVLPEPGSGGAPDRVIGEALAALGIEEISR